MQKLPFGKLVKIKTGKLDANAKVDGGQYPFFTCSKDISRINSYSYDCECVLVAGNGDLNVKYYNGKFDAYQRTYIIENNKTYDLDMKYLYYFMQSYIDKLRSQTIGGVIQYIKLNNLTDIDFPLPPLSTQKQIISKLDTLSNLINLKKEQIKKQENLTKSIFIEMFGDPMINEKGWEFSTLGKSCYFIKDGPHKSLNYIEKGVPFVSVNNIIKGFWDFENVKFISQEDYNFYSKRCKPEYGDILYTKGGTTGFAKYVDLKINFLNWVHLAVLKFDKNILNGRFLESILNTSYCYEQSQRYTRGIANRDLVLSQMALIKIFLPPISLQNKFASIVEKNDEIITKQKESLKKLEELYNGVMQESFRV